MRPEDCVSVLYIKIDEMKQMEVSVEMDPLVSTRDVFN